MTFQNAHASPWLLAGAMILAIAPARSAGAAGPTTTHRTVTVVNHAQQPVRMLRISTSGEDNWGDDRLATHPLAKGRSAVVALDSNAGCRYDIQVTYQDDAVEENRDVDICRTRQLGFDGSNAVAVPTATADVTIANHATMDIKSVFISPASASKWGKDWLGDDQLSPQDSKAAEYRGACAADIRVVFKNGSAEERHNLDVCANTSVTIAPGWTTTDPDDMASATPAATPGGNESKPAQPGQSSIEIRNQSGKTLSSLYLYPEGTSDQGEDLLGSGSLDDRAAQPVSVTLGGKCSFTMRARFQERDDDTVRHNIDLCNGDARVVLTASMLIDATMLNAGTLPVVNLYVDAPGTALGADLLGDGVIARGAKYTLSPPLAGVCQYHITGIFRDGRTATADGDLCKNNPVVLR